MTAFLNLKPFFKRLNGRFKVVKEETAVIN